MTTIANTSAGSAEYQIWLRAFLRALDGCAPEEAEELARRAVEIYQKQWGKPVVNNRQGLDESERLINLLISNESEELDKMISAHPEKFDYGVDDERGEGDGVGGGVARASAGGESTPDAASAEPVTPDGALGMSS